ncbi:nanor [Engraulis encrasicolus]|uniref:nanor n=2 Tax=Engraulis encrasicolus TaxID=184585 RepID=UPI002FD13412
MAFNRPAIIQPYVLDPLSDPDAEQEEEEAPRSPRIPKPVSEWCRCGNCGAMPTEHESLCCQEVPEVTRRMEQVEGTQPQCVIDHPGFYATSLNVYVLQAMYNIYRADHGPVRLRGIEHRYRYLAYRMFVSWCWGFLGRHIRVVVPSCVVLRVRREFPDSQQQYMGFRLPPLR